MKLSKDLEQGNIGSEAAINALMEGLKDAYSGIDAETARSTASGIMSQIKDTFKIDVVKRWGKGLQDGAVKSLSSVLDLVEENDELITKLGDTFYELGSSLSGKFATGVEKVSKRLLKVLKSPEFENASIGGKFKIVWDEVVANPFSEWWDTKGKKFFVDKAEGLGKSLGTGFSNGLLGILGFDVVGAGEDGLSIGSAFCKGFIDGIDTEAIKDALVKAFKDAAKDALKVLPGGDSPTTSSWISAILLGALGKKLGLGKLLGKGGSWLSSSWGKQFGATSDDVAYQAWLKANANPTNKGGWLSKITGSKWFGKLTGSADELLTSGGKLGSFLGGLTKTGKGVGKFLKGNWLSLLFSGAAIATSDDKAKTTVEQGAGLAGSAAGGALGGKIGAAIGTFIVPGTGTAIGGGIGSLLGSTLGYIGAETGAGALWDKAKTWWSGDYDPEKGVLAGGGKDFFKEWGGSIKTNFEELTGNLKTSWDSAVEQFKGIPDTISTSFGNAWDNVCTGVEEDFADLSVWWEDTMEVINTFFNETLPEWWSEKVEAVGTFFTETLPEWWEEKIGLVETFFTETLPGWFEEAVDNFVTYWTVDVPAYWNGKADEIASGWGDVKQYFKDKADELVGWFNEKKEEVKTAWEGSTVKKGIDTGVSWVKEKLGIEGEHATGGIFSRPHVGLVAEDGPEAIIPLGGKRRQRGLDLWERAGKALGVTPYANGGIVGRVSSGGGSSNINLGGVTVNITVDGGTGTLVDALNSQSEEIKEAIAGILYDALAKNFNNMPITI